MTSRLFPIAVLGVLVTSLGCASSNLPVQMRGLQLESLRPNLGDGSVELVFLLRFRLNNPSSTSLPILAHTASFQLDGESVGTVEHLFPPGLELPANGSTELDYRVRLDTGQLDPGMLGRDVEYRFGAEIELPIPTETEPALDALGLSPQLTLAFEDTLRLPLLPKVALHGTPSLALVGGTLITVPRTLDLALGGAVRGFVVGGLEGVGLSDVADDWGDFLDAVLTPNVDIVKMTPITGLQAKVPVRISNPNQFEIELPSLGFDFATAGGDVWTVTQTPNDGSLAPKDQPGDHEDVTYESTFSFEGLGDLVIPSANRTLAVDAAVDLGHGRTQLELRVP